MSDELSDRLAAAARTPVLLVACDYDGTLAPIVEDPSEARPHRESHVALRALASLPSTHVAVISGRALRDLAELTGLPQDIHLVGSHGSEFDPGFADRLPTDAAALRARVLEELRGIAGDGDRFLLEEKPASIAFHYRNAAEHDADRAVRAVLDGPAAIEGVFTKHGKKVVELAVLSTNKGDALQTIRRRVGATAVIYLGDDITDEDAFATLAGPDLGVKVGDGDTLAPFRLADTEQVSRMLARLCELREAWLSGADAVPIEHHSALSDHRTIALVTPAARIVYCCLPRIDSPALFAELLGGTAAGYFAVRPERNHHAGGPAQAYLDDTMVLLTRWPSLTVTDFLDCSSSRTGQRAGRTDLVRILEGTGSAIVEFAPRLDFGRVPTRLIRREGGLEIADTHDPIVLRSPGVEWEIATEGPHHTARAVVRLTDRPLALELRYGTATLREGGGGAVDRLRLTERYWSSWAEQLTLPRTARELVRRSALVLKSLCYEPTGAILAAGTTSLPEHLGGVRNWDYRFCWPRDAAMAASALVRLGSQREAMRFLDWVLGVIDECAGPERLRPLYSVTGSELGPEGELTELSGYRGSRPVRVGNSAARQVQLDVFGPIVELVHRLMEAEAPLSNEHWRLVEAMVDAVSRRWSEPDHGIWEIRKPTRHHVHSKVMCWMTVDRGMRIAQRFFDRERADWHHLRDRIATDVVEHGWKSAIGAFTAAYDGDDLDAAALTVGLSGLLAPDDPRFASTVEQVERGLRRGPTVYRYRADDGLPGAEGGWYLCSMWLIMSYLIAGRLEDAHALFEGMAATAGPTGLFTEQYDPDAGIGLGNYPQAYSHVALINAAFALDHPEMVIGRRGDVAT